MRTHEIEIKRIHSQSELVQLIKKEEVRKGDIIKVFTEDKKNDFVIYAIIFMVIYAVILVLDEKKRKKVEDGSMILNSLFADKSVDEIEKEIEREYGIKIEVSYNGNQEEKEWRELSMDNFVKSYSQDEPEYTDADIKEPNVEYKEWKKDK